MFERTYGAPLSKEMVRTLRERAGLSQEALAARLGLAHKSVVSGWETGRTTCEGPAAELLLHLFAADTSRTFSELDNAAESTWRRVGTWHDTWRQVAAVPEAPHAIERDCFAGLFPGTEISPEQHANGFPFVAITQPHVLGIGAQGWSGTMPAEQERAPRYVWQLDRTGGFLYRETLWEEADDSTTGGHTQVGSLLELATCTTVFLGRFARAAKLERAWRYVLRLDLEGMRGRGIVAASPAGHATDPPKMLSNEKHLVGTFACALEDVVTDPVRTACALVGEVLMLIRPELAAREQLEKELRAWHELDRAREVRRLGMLDTMLG